MGTLLIIDRRASTLSLQAFDKYNKMIQDTTFDLEAHLRDIDSKLNALASQSITPAASVEGQHMREERESAQQCLQICENTKAHLQGLQARLPSQPTANNVSSDQASLYRVHILEDISVADNSHQVVVATLGDLLNAKGISAGNGSVQWVGSMTESSLQQLSRDRLSNSSTDTTGKSTQKFSMYGTGRKLPT